MRGLSEGTVAATVNSSAIPGVNNMLRELIRIPSRISAKVADRFNQMKDATWRAGQDMYRKPWAPLKASTIKRKRGDTRILIREDELRPATRFIARAGGGLSFVVGASGIYAQRGSPVRAPRRVVPDAGLPAHMRAELKRIATEEAVRIVHR